MSPRTSGLCCTCRSGNYAGRHGTGRHIQAVALSGRPCARLQPELQLGQAPPTRQAKHDDALRTAGAAQPSAWLKLSRRSLRRHQPGALLPGLATTVAQGGKTLPLISLRMARLRCSNRSGCQVIAGMPLRMARPRCPCHSGCQSVTAPIAQAVLTPLLASLWMSRRRPNVTAPVAQDVKTSLVLSFRVTRPRVERAPPCPRASKSNPIGLARGGAL